MDFELPVSFEGKNFIFPGRLHLFGYTQKIELNVHGLTVFYERDEERNWRAIVDPSALEVNGSIKPGLLEAISHAIDEVLR